MPKGGKRINSGRPKNSGKYNEQTRAVRIPLSKIDTVMQVIEDGVVYKRPLYSCKVRAGFPSPADDYIEAYLDLNKYLIQHPSATFFVKASGDSMVKAGIACGNLLIVDRSIQPTHGRIVVAAVNGELTVKRLSLTNGQTRLVAENDAYAPILITEALELVIWGVVIHNIQSSF